MATADDVRTQSISELYFNWIGGERGLEAYRRLSMALLPGSNYPGGSKERVRRAGDAVRAGTASTDDLAVIDLWRSSHRPVLNTFQSILRNRTRGKKILVAQRHKRRATIFDKLMRFPKMQLSRMDDIAGCRLIFDSVEDLIDFRLGFHKANFNHRRRNADDKYNYISNPNPETGYRGIHDVYEYDVRSQYADIYRGLLIEIQYRTRIQHAWATCVELIGFITENQPKFKKGDKRFQHILLLASEILARCFENSKSSLPNIADADLIKEFIDLDIEIGFINLLRGLNATNAEVSKNKNMILIFSADGSLDVQSYRDAPDALRALFKLEQEPSGKDIVLVRADTADEVRVAFKNYFSDAHEFLDLIDRGCQKLAGPKYAINRPRRTRPPLKGPAMA